MWLRVGLGWVLVGIGDQHVLARLSSSFELLMGTGGFEQRDTFGYDRVEVAVGGRSEEIGQG